MTKSIEQELGMVEQKLKHSRKELLNQLDKLTMKTYNLIANVKEGSPLAIDQTIVNDLTYGLDKVAIEYTVLMAKRASLSNIKG